MTEKKLEEANKNREERTRLLKQYEEVSCAINSFTSKGFVFRAIVQLPNTTCYRDIYPSAKEFRLMLLNVRDRLDAEIARLDKEFTEL